jgi:hypothetical protein
MRPEYLPDPEELWWAWVALAALHRAVGDDRCGFDVEQRVLHLDAGDGSWLRMQRTLGSRATLWGRSSLASSATADPRRLAPDWAVSDATLTCTPSFIAWHAHGEWDTSSPGTDEGAIHLLRPVQTVDPRFVEAVRGGRWEPDALAEWTDGEHLQAAAELVRQAATDTVATPAPSAVRARLRDQIHGQMRDSAEADRMLMQRPPTLVQWSRINGPAWPFEYAVMITRDRISPAPTNTPLPAPTVRSLDNVLRTLHGNEATEESGAWLFARVTSDGVVVRFDRAFDSWPEWYQVHHASQGPSLEDLAWEMWQRDRHWRPAWASLLPRI